MGKTRQNLNADMIIEKAEEDNVRGKKKGHCQEYSTNQKRYCLYEYPVPYGKRQNDKKREQENSNDIYVKTYSVQQRWKNLFHIQHGKII